MRFHTFLLKYGEIGVKGKNRYLFEDALVNRVRGALADVPSPFLHHLGSLHIAPIPVFLGYYGSTVTNLYREVEDPACDEEFHIMPKLASGPQTGERLLAAWLEKGEELFSARPLLNESLTTQLVHAMCKNRSVEVIDGMTGAATPNFKLLGMAMTVATMLRQRGDARIGIILPPGPGAVVALLSCLLAGITPVMINYATSRASFESTVRQAGLRTFITARKFMQKLPNFAWLLYNIFIAMSLAKIKNKKI